MGRGKLITTLAIVASLNTNFSYALREQHQQQMNHHKYELGRHNEIGKNHARTRQPNEATVSHRKLGKNNKNTNGGGGHTKTAKTHDTKSGKATNEGDEGHSESWVESDAKSSKSAAVIDASPDGEEGWSGGAVSHGSKSGKATVEAKSSKMTEAAGEDDSRWDTESPVPADSTEPTHSADDSGDWWGGPHQISKSGKAGETTPAPDSKSGKQVKSAKAHPSPDESKSGKQAKSKAKGGKMAKSERDDDEWWSGESEGDDWWASPSDAPMAEPESIPSMEPTPCGKAGKDCESNAPVPVPDCENIVDIAVGNPDFSILVAALTAAGLVETLSGDGPFTVFAPPNAAFEALPEGTIEALLDDIPTLTAILTYHVVSGNVLSTDLVDGPVPTLNGADVDVDLSNGVMINDANVVAADNIGCNGVIHVIDKVLIPPAPAPSPAPSAKDSSISSGTPTPLTGAIPGTPTARPSTGWPTYSPTASPSSTIESIMRSGTWFQSGLGQEFDDLQIDLYQARSKQGMRGPGGAKKEDQKPGKQEKNGGEKYRMNDSSSLASSRSSGDRIGGSAILVMIAGVMASFFVQQHHLF